MKKTIIIFCAAVVALTTGLIATAEAQAQDPITIAIDEMRFEYVYSREATVLETPTYDSNYMYMGEFHNENGIYDFQFSQFNPAAFTGFIRQATTNTQPVTVWRTPFVYYDYGFENYNGSGLHFIVQMRYDALLGEAPNGGPNRNFGISLNYEGAKGITLNATLTITTQFQPVIIRKDYRDEYKAVLFGAHYGDEDFFEIRRSLYAAVDKCFANTQTKLGSLLGKNGAWVYRENTNAAHAACTSDYHNDRAAAKSADLYFHLEYRFSACLVDSFGKGVITTPIARTQKLAKDLRDALMTSATSSSGQVLYKWRIVPATGQRYNDATADTICQYLKETDYSGWIPPHTTASDIISAALE